MVKKREGIVTKSEIAKYFNVTHTTVTRWEKFFPELFKKYGKEEAKGMRVYYSYDEKIVGALEKRIAGRIKQRPKPERPPN